MHGNIPNIKMGDTFVDRRECLDKGVHRSLQGGIAGWGNNQPAESIVLSGGYEDNIDNGDLIIYTGDGGRDPNTGKQIEDQEKVRGNAGLWRSWSQNVPIRVIRKPSIYRFDGLYEITEVPRYQRSKNNGPFIYRYTLETISGASTKEKKELFIGSLEPGRQSVTTLRTVRQTTVSNYIKRLYGYKCQICRVRITIPTGGYAEAAHVKPLGRPHNGPDVPENVLCLCPNCHVLFDRGAIGIAEDLSLINIEGSLNIDDRHYVSDEYLGYHRNLYGLNFD